MSEKVDEHGDPVDFETEPRMQGDKISRMTCHCRRHNVDVFVEKAYPGLVVVKYWCETHKLVIYGVMTPPEGITLETDVPVVRPAGWTP